MTYDELVTRLKQYSNTDDPESFNLAIPGMIADAEDRISKQLEIDAEIANDVVTAPIAAGQRLVTKPPLAKAIGMFRMRPVNVSFAKWITLQIRTRAWCEDFWPVRESASNPPRYYCVFNAETLMVVPTLATAHTAEISYTTYISGLSPTKSTTWLSVHAAELLTEAALAKVAEFQKNPVRHQVHEDRYKALLETEQTQGILRMRDSLRMM